MRKKRKSSQLLQFFYISRWKSVFLNAKQVKKDNCTNKYFLKTRLFSHIALQKFRKFKLIKIVCRCVHQIFFEWMFIFKTHFHDVQEKSSRNYFYAKKKKKKRTKKWEYSFTSEKYWNRKSSKSSKRIKTHQTFKLRVWLTEFFLNLARNINFEFFFQTIYNNSESALKDVRKNEVWALLHFPNNYTRSLAEMTKLITNRHEHVDTETFINGFVNSWIDLSSTNMFWKTHADFIRLHTCFEK